ncbi:MAG TPA: GNAT family N-acetyltransferase [Gemmatimonadales bacterium]|nr:GNAT family N-acetyltransferase [Gemmatimonadales bacterium]
MHVEHDTQAHRFVAQVSSGTAVLAYAAAGPGLIELYSTFVPAPDRGRGVGGRLVEAALGYAREQGMRVIPTCQYVAQWIGEHPENADLLAMRGH